MIDSNTTQSVAGMIDLYEFEPHHKRAGVGILIDKPFRKQGIASMALDLISEYAFSFLHLHQLFAHIPVCNTPSLALFEKNGFVFSGTLQDWLYTSDGYTDVCIMQKIRKE